MNQLDQFIQTARIYAYILLLTSNILVITTAWVCVEVFGLAWNITLAIAAMLGLLLPIFFAWAVSNLFLQPLRSLWQAILYISPDTHDVPAPEIQSIHYGKTLVTNLVSHVYQLADASKHLAEVTQHTQADSAMETNFVANSMPIPLIILDKEDTVLFANKALLDYVGKTHDEVIGQSMYSSIDMSFSDDNTFDTWLQHAKESAVTNQQTWERVKLTLPGDQPESRMFDLAAYYNKENPSGYETMLVLFDHTKTYHADDQAVSFVALAVHELRTPLTMLRGYIEALQEDLEGKLTPELNGFMRNLQASAQQLATFVNNVLNVARIEENQMFLKLQEADWPTALTKMVNDLSLRAQVHGITLKTQISPGVPHVGIDTVSMYEVMSNLVDNAIKYSASSKEIVISAQLTKDGMVETTVQDFGVGIPGSAVSHIFAKYYRDHHNRQQVGGTGMGLYLCKTLVNAHGGNIWVRSKEGKGSTFGFTLVPYTQLAEELKNTDNASITRNAHGWIKNHSLYRR